MLYFSAAIGNMFPDGASPKSKGGMKAYEKVFFGIRPPRMACLRVWPYCFGNCYLDVDKMENKKPLKRMANCKIDAAIGGLMTFWMYNNFEF